MGTWEYGLVAMVYGDCLEPRSTRLNVVIAIRRGRYVRTRLWLPTPGIICASSLREKGVRFE
jgi:hypothetical protein